MALREELQEQGNWCFRWRSYLPLLIVPILFVALRSSESLERVFGNIVDNVYEGLCLMVAFAGLTIRCIAVGYVAGGTSGRNTISQEADTLNTTGMYAMSRHPLYFGNFVIFLGLTLFVGVWWFTLIAILAFLVYYERIIFAEEEFLRKKFGRAYLEYATRTPVFWPALRGWQQPSLPFSFRKVLKREYSGFFAIIASFTLLEFIGDLIVEKRFELSVGWIVFFLLGLFTYLSFAGLKKKTRFLNVDGR